MEKDFTIGVLIGNANSSYTRDLMQGIRQEAETLGVHLVFFLGIHSSYYYRSYFGEDTDDDYDYQFNTVYDYVDFSRLDALLISYGTLCIFLGDQEQEAFLERFRALPCVYIEERDEKGRSMSLINDNYGGMYALAEHLVRDHGYRKLTYLSGPRENTDSRERKEAVLDVTKKYGVPFDESHIAYGDFSPCVEEEVRTLMDRYPDMEAMICANDCMADTAYREARRRGRKIGKDLAVTGYDDSDQAANMDPPLTTVFQDPCYMGRRAVLGAMELCQKKEGKTVVVPSRLVLRQSCGCRPEEKTSGKLNMAAFLLREQEKAVKYQQESWFLPLISRDMICHMEDEQEIYRRALIKFAPLEAKKSWLYIFPQPVIHQQEDNWSCPDVMYLAAMQEGNNVISFPAKERPVIRKHGRFQESITGWQVKDGKASASCVFCLFSGETQYGVLVTEIDPAKISLFYLISRQIGNMLRLYESNKVQRHMQKKLEVLVQEIREKNEVLNFISASDPLTGCLNRRGFMEKIMQLNRRNQGCEAILFVADLDHLKEINDCFGHMEGDFAIRHCAELLSETLGENGIVGRIGGDEFCCMLPGGADAAEKICEKLREAGVLFNRTSEKAYYVELSLGYTTLTCDESLVLSEILKEADKNLYEEKKKRRSSVKKLNI